MRSPIVSGSAGVPPALRLYSKVCGRDARAPIFVCSVLLAAIACAAAFAADQPYIQVRSNVDRNALWVGDRFHDVITVIHDPQVHFVTDNLQKSTLNLQPFEVLNVKFGEAPAAGGRNKFEIDLLLTTYEAEAGELKIPSFNLFYFVDTAVATPNADRPAETLVVPATPVALRSTVPENVSTIRDSIAPPSEPLRHRIALPVSVGMFVLALLLLLPMIFHGKHLRTAQEITRRRKQAQDQLRASAARLLGRSVDSEANMAEFYDQADRAMREYLSAISVIPTEGKTPRELSAMLAGDPVNGDVVNAESLRDIVAILDSCERVRYAPDFYVIGTEQHGHVMERLRALAE